MNRRMLGRLAARFAAACMAVGLAAGVALADEAPDAMVLRISNDVLKDIRSDKSMVGDVSKIIKLVDTKIMPSVDFTRMTASAVGPGWRKATPEQQTQLQDQFKTLLVRTYSGALAQVSDQTISAKPLRMAPDDKEVLVRTEVRGKGDPVQLDYRMEKTDDGSWKIYNLNVMGVWLVETYRSQFSQEINAHGVDGLIKMLGDLNQANAKKG